MARPDQKLIAQVTLFCQGFRIAESLAPKIVPFLNICGEQLTQPLYVQERKFVESNVVPGNAETWVSPLDGKKETSTHHSREVLGVDGDGHMD